jgi:hypothetical protein
VKTVPEMPGKTAHRARLLPVLVLCKWIQRQNVRLSTLME